MIDVKIFFLISLHYYILSAITHIIIIITVIDHIAQGTNEAPIGLSLSKIVYIEMHVSV